MNAIGGFFELEVPRGSGPYHTTAMPLSCGRACLRHALTYLSPRRVLLPFYVCDAVLEPLRTIGVPYEFYPIGENLEPLGDPPYRSDEIAIYVNYFGLKGEIAGSLAQRLGSTFVVDDTQAFYERGRPGSWSFNSARKFFGVPDGAYLYSPVPLAPPDARNDVPVWDHLIGRLSGQQAAAYAAFKSNEAAFTSEVRGMSVGAERLLAGIDYGSAALRRRENYEAYEASLGSLNRLRLRMSAEAVPLCYPFLPPKRIDRAALTAKEIYTPAYWLDCESRGPSGFAWERQLSSNLLALPVDQRYGSEEMARVVTVVQRLLEN